MYRKLAKFNYQFLCKLIIILNFSPWRWVLAISSVENFNFQFENSGFEKFSPSHSINYFAILTFSSISVTREKLPESILFTILSTLFSKALFRATSIFSRSHQRVKRSLKLVTSLVLHARMIQPRHIAEFGVQKISNSRFISLRGTFCRVEQRHCASNAPRECK